MLNFTDSWSDICIATIIAYGVPLVGLWLIYKLSGAGRQRNWYDKG